MLPGSAGWRQVLLRPGEHPDAELGHALDGDRLDRVFGQLLTGCADRARGRPVGGAVHAVRARGTACGVLEQLVAAARDPERRALVVVSMRADFYGRLASYPRFAELLSGSHLLLGAMDRDELAQAIEQPAGRAGLRSSMDWSTRWCPTWRVSREPAAALDDAARAMAGLRWADAAL